MTLRVAYVVDEWVTLSQTFIRQEVAELRRQGVEVEVIALAPGDQDPAIDEPARLLSSHADSLPARAAAMGRQPLATARLALIQASMRPERIHHRAQLPSLARRLRREGVAWVHAHFGWEASGVAEGLARLMGVGWSFTAHANDIFVANEHLAGKLDRADRLVTVCRYNEEQLRLRYPRLPPVEIVICGVDLPARTSPRPIPTIDVLAVGRLVPKKGFDLLVEAADRVRTDRPGLKVEVVGAGPELERLDALVQERDLRDTVALVGPRPHAWVLERMSLARLVCLPARVADDGDRDSMPVVLKEAMARSVPVVATSVAAIPELVDATVGRLVPPDDVGALAEALGDLLDDPDRARALGETGRTRIEDHFTLSGEVARLRTCFERWSGSTGDQSTTVR